MRHSLEPEYRKYVKGYGFLSFARNFGDKYGKKLMNTAIKTGTNFNSKYGKDENKNRERFCYDCW